MAQAQAVGPCALINLIRFDLISLCMSARSQSVTVCVQPRPSALDMTLPAFAAGRGRLQQISIDSRYAARGAQQQTNHTALLLSIDGTDGRTGWFFSHGKTQALHFRTFPMFFD